MGKHISVGTAALREIAGGAGGRGDGPVEISMRESDFQVISVKNPQTGQDMPAPATAKVNFVAKSFRELVDNDNKPLGMWEFTVESPAPAGQVSTARVYVDGRDIFYVKVFSRLDL